jgi:hypothetical protein
MSVLKGYGLTDYGGAKSYEDFLEPGEKVFFVSEGAKYTYVTSASTDSLRAAKSHIISPFVVTNKRAFMIYVKRVPTGILSSREVLQIGIEGIYDYDYAKKILAYSVDAIKRVNVSGYDMLKAWEEEGEHRSDLYSIPVLGKIRMKKSILGGESLVLDVTLIPTAKFAAFQQKVMSGVVRLFSLGMKSSATVYPVEIRRPFTAVSPEARKYAKDTEHPNSEQVCEFLQEQVNNMAGRLDEIRSLAKKAEESGVM